MIARWQWRARLAGAATVLPLVLGVMWLRPTSGPATSESGPPPSFAQRNVSAVPDSLGRIAEARQPFRPDGEPAGLKYDPTRGDDQHQRDPDPPRPHLTVTGLTGGAAPAAIVEGIPGHEGPLLMAVGDSAGGMWVRRIRGGIVTISGMDTTWAMSVKEVP